MEYIQWSTDQTRKQLAVYGNTNDARKKTIWCLFEDVLLVITHFTLRRKRSSLSYSHKSTQFYCIVLRSVNVDGSIRYTGIHKLVPPAAS